MEVQPAPAVAQPTAAPPPQISQKRPLEGQLPLQETSSYKVREIVREIRPHLLEVLSRTMDYRNSKGAHEIREKLKLLMELSQQMKAETVLAAKRMKSETPSLPSDNGVGTKPQEQVQEPQSLAKPSEVDALQSVIVEKLLAEVGEKPGTHIVGGSSFGQNFITYTSSELFYYGRTKEEFRASQATV